MTSQEYKTKYLVLLSDLELSPALSTVLKLFIETYTGNEEQFVKALNELFEILIEREELEIKAAAYDEISKIISDNKSSVDELMASIDELMMNRRLPASGTF